MKIIIQAVQFTADQKLMDLAQSKLEKLTHFYDRIIDATVYFKIDGKSSHIKDKQVEIKLNIPGSQIFVREDSKVFEEALDQAVDATARQLKRIKEKRMEG